MKIGAKEAVNKIIELHNDTWSQLLRSQQDKETTSMCIDFLKQDHVLAQLTDYIDSIQPDRFVTQGPIQLHTDRTTVYTMWSKLDHPGMSTGVSEVASA